MIIIIIVLVFLFIYINQLLNVGKRFQESNKIEQIWRYRFYLYIPFKWVWYSIAGFKVYMDEHTDDGKIVHTDKYTKETGKQLWQLLKGIQQGDMEWYYTSEEVFDNIHKKYKL